MLRLPSGTNGTVQALLDEPGSAMWWSITEGSVHAGRDLASQPDVIIRASSGRFVLGLAGRLRPREALDSTGAIEGDHVLAERFLGACNSAAMRLVGKPSSTSSVISRSRSERPYARRTSNTTWPT